MLRRRDLFGFVSIPVPSADKNQGLFNTLTLLRRRVTTDLELWMNDIKDYLKQGNTVQSLKSLLFTKRIAVDNVISFTSWLVNDNTKEKLRLWNWRKR